MCWREVCNWSLSSAPESLGFPSAAGGCPAGRPLSPPGGWALASGAGSSHGRRVLSEILNSGGEASGAESSRALPPSLRHLHLLRFYNIWRPVDVSRTTLEMKGSCDSCERFLSPALRNAGGAEAAARMAHAGQRVRRLAEILAHDTPVLARPA